MPKNDVDPSKFDALSRDIGRAAQLHAIGKSQNAYANALLFLVDSIMEYFECPKGSWKPDHDSKEPLDIMWGRSIVAVDVDWTVAGRQFRMRVGTTEAPQQEKDGNTWSLYLFGDLFGIVDLSAENPLKSIEGKLMSFVSERLKQEVYRLP